MYLNQLTMWMMSDFIMLINIMRENIMFCDRKEFQVMKRVITIPYGPAVTKVFSIWHTIRAGSFDSTGLQTCFGIDETDHSREFK